MKARVKATGQIVTLDSRCNVTEIVKGGHPRMWTLAELELEDEPDYWTRLEHQYVGMAMQGLMSILPQIGGLNGRSPKTEIIDITIDIAHALVEKMKNTNE